MMDCVTFACLTSNLLIDTTFSWVRMFIALGLSILISIAVGIYAATSRAAERIILPIVDILQTLPILAFFPFMIYIVVSTVPGALGVNIAVIFLIVTSMIWNIIFGVYEGVKTLPKEYFELSALYRLRLSQKLRKIFIPAIMPRVIEQSILSWSIGLFYLVTSEIFSTGTTTKSVAHGIGVAITTYAATGAGYVLALVIFIMFVIATRFLFFRPLEEHFTRYNRDRRLAMPAEARRATYARGVDTVGARIMKRLGTDRIRRFGSRVAKGTRRIGKRISVVREGGVSETAGVFVKYLISILVIAGLTYMIATNIGTIEGLAGDEYKVLLALAFSFVRVWVAFAISLAIGIPVCVYLIFISRHSDRYLLFFQILASIPATILLPVIAISLKGLPHYGEFVAFIVFILGSIWYIIFSTMNMTRTLPSNIFEVKKIFGVKGWDAWKKIYLKAIVPGLITGAITAIAAEWNASIVAEYFQFGTNTVLAQVGTGIGKLLDLSLASNDLTLMLIALANLTAMILIINTFVWKRLYRSVSKVYR